MRLVGLVAGGSSSTIAPVIVWDKVEHLAREEQLVIIEDSRRGMRYLGVIRGVRRHEPFLNTYRRTSYVDNPSLADAGVLAHSSCYVVIICIVEDGSMREPDLPPNPGSKVYIIESPRDLQVSLGEGIVVGSHKHSGIEVPLNPAWLTHHVCIVGATGTGKSRLARALVNEILDKTDYKVVIFDHTGMDYTPFYGEEHVFSASRVIIDLNLLADLMLRRCGLNPNYYEQYIVYSILKYIYDYYRNRAPDVIRSISQPASQLFAQRTLDGSSGFESFVENLDFSKLLEAMAEHPVEWVKSKFRKKAVEAVSKLGGKPGGRFRIASAIDVKLGDSFFKSLSNRDVLPKKIVETAWEKGLAIVDLSGEDPEVKRYIVASVLNEVLRVIESERRMVNTIALIDEAHNYACRGCGEAHYAIARVAREGRKWGFGLILATQRIIDVDPEIRSNINTWFFSRLQTPSDYNELRGYMDLAGVSEYSLAVLGRREFYVAGLMNPLRIPVLLRVKSVE